MGYLVPKVMKQTGATKCFLAPTSAPRDGLRLHGQAPAVRFGTEFDQEPLEWKGEAAQRGRRIAGALGGTAPKSEEPWPILLPP